jgi:hypothetical protein
MHRLRLAVRDRVVTRYTVIPHAISITGRAKASMCRTTVASREVLPVGAGRMGPTMR